jgi:hypothetical protein
MLPLLQPTSLVPVTSSTTAGPPPSPGGQPQLYASSQVPQVRPAAAQEHHIALLQSTLTTNGGMSCYQPQPQPQTPQLYQQQQPPPQQFQSQPTMAYSSTQPALSQVQPLFTYSAPSQTPPSAQSLTDGGVALSYAPPSNPAGYLHQPQPQPQFQHHQPMMVQHQYQQQQQQPQYVQLPHQQVIYMSSTPPSLPLAHAQHPYPQQQQPTILVVQQPPAAYHQPTYVTMAAQSQPHFQPPPSHAQSHPPVYYTGGSSSYALQPQPQTLTLVGGAGGATHYVAQQQLPPSPPSPMYNVTLPCASTNIVPASTPSTVTTPSITTTSGVVTSAEGSVVSFSFPTLAQGGPHVPNEHAAGQMQPQHNYCQPSQSAPPPPPLPPPSPTSTVSGGGGNKDTTEKCYLCHQPGHYARMCTTMTRAMLVSPLTCYRCQQRGHIAKNCPSRQQQREERDTNSFYGGGAAYVTVGLPELSGIIASQSPPVSLLGAGGLDNSLNSSSTPASSMVHLYDELDKK